MDILAGEDWERSVGRVCKKPIIWQPLKLGYTFLRRDDEQASPINPELLMMAALNKLFVLLTVNLCTSPAQKAWRSSLTASF